MKRPYKKKRPTQVKKRRKQASRPSGASPPRWAPQQTDQEIKYLKRLIENKVPVVIRLRSNEELTGILEYYDSKFIRLTRQDEPNLFIFKHEVKYLYEIPKSTS